MDFSKMFKDTVSGIKDEATLRAEFRELIGEKVETTVKLPEDEEERRAWFTATIWKAAKAGKSKKQIVAHIAALRLANGSMVGEKSALKIFDDAEETRRAEEIYKILPGINKLKKDDQRRCLVAFWTMKEIVKVDGDEMPLITVVDYKDSLKLFKRGASLGRKMHLKDAYDEVEAKSKEEGGKPVDPKEFEGRATTKEVAEFQQIEKTLNNYITEVKAARAVVKREVDKFFNKGEHARRGRGPSVYSSISGAITFE